jgi:hypothetical protein
MGRRLAMTKVEVEQEREIHESYGMVEVSRISSGNENLFGSSASHQNKIRVRVYRGEMWRKRGEEKYDQVGSPLIAFDLSEVQFAHMLTTQNIHPGTPCTISILNGKAVATCPKPETLRTRFVGEVDSVAKRVTNSVESLMEAVTGILRKDRPTKTERQEAVSIVENIRRELSEQIPLLSEVFSETMESMVTNAKAEIESMFRSRIEQIGLEAMGRSEGIPIAIPDFGGASSVIIEESGSQAGVPEEVQVTGQIPGDVPRSSSDGSGQKLVGED